MSYAFVEDVAASWEQYEPLRAALVEETPSGLIVHLAGPTDEGFRVIGIWRSEEAWARFVRDRLGTPHAFAGATQVPPVFRALRPEHVVYGTKEASWH
jgi:hypothetical protein